MAFTLIQAAQDRWRAVNGPHLVALVRAGATIVNGKLVGRPDDNPTTSHPESRIRDLHPQVVTIALSARPAGTTEIAADRGNTAPVAPLNTGATSGAAVSGFYAANPGARVLIRVGE